MNEKYFNSDDMDQIEIVSQQELFWLRSKMSFFLSLLCSGSSTGKHGIFGFQLMLSYGCKWNIFAESSFTVSVSMARALTTRMSMHAHSQFGQKRTMGNGAETFRKHDMNFEWKRTPKRRTSAVTDFSFTRCWIKEREKCAKRRWKALTVRPCLMAVCVEYGVLCISFGNLRRAHSVA